MMIYCESLTERYDDDHDDEMAMMIIMIMIMMNRIMLVLYQIVEGSKKSC